MGCVMIEISKGARWRTPNLMGDFLEEVTLKTISLKNFSNLVRA